MLVIYLWPVEELVKALLIVDLPCDYRSPKMYRLFIVAASLKIKLYVAVMAKNIIPSSRKIPFTKEDMKDIIRYNQELHKSGYTLPPFRNISMPVQVSSLARPIRSLHSANLDETDESGCWIRRCSDVPGVR